MGGSFMPHAFVLPRHLSVAILWCIHCAAVGHHGRLAFESSEGATGVHEHWKYDMV